VTLGIVLGDHDPPESEIEGWNAASGRVDKGAALTVRFIPAARRARVYPADAHANAVRFRLHPGRS